jgi:hypothetical protein
VQIDPCIIHLGYLLPLPLDFPQGPFIMQSLAGGSFFI